MNKARLRAILRILENSGLVVVSLDENLWMVPIPVTVKTIHTLNEDGFQPLEVRNDLTAARIVLLGFKDHEPPSLQWREAGATYWSIQEEDDVLAALAAAGFDLRK